MALCGFCGKKIWQQRISTKKCCPRRWTLPVTSSSPLKSRSFGGTLSWRWRGGKSSVRVVQTATTRILRRRFPGTCEMVEQVFKFVWRLHWKINAVCLLLSPFFSFQSRVVTYLLTYPRKMPTRCNRGFYCRSYCLLNMMFRAPLCPSSGAQEYYTVVAACGISCCGFQVAGLLWSWELCVRFANWTHNSQLHNRPATWKLQHEIPRAATTV